MEEGKQKQQKQDHPQGLCESMMEQEKYCQKLTSEFHDDYVKYIQNIKTEEQKKELQKTLRNHNIFRHESNFRHELQFQIIETDLQSFTLYLFYGQYKLKVNILTIELNKDFFNSSLISFGSFGNIYSITAAQGFCAVKIVQLNQKTFDSDLKHVYKQYFLFKIASILEVGPKAYTPFGYDIIVTRNEAFFAMELCYTQKIQKLKQIEKQSLENLRVLHSLNFMHLDIKPANLAYSPTFQKSIFIDFGLSRLIFEDVGYKTITSFVGTLSYCSDEMRNTYYLNKKRPVDMYYNDIISLQTTLRIIKERNLCKSQDEAQGSDISKTKCYQFQRTQNIIEESIYIFQLKNYIFQRNTELVITTLSRMVTMPKCFFQLLNHKVTQHFIDKKELVKHQIAEIRTKIIKKKYMGNLADNMISQALAKANENENGWLFGCKLSQLSINLPNSQFKQLLEDQVFISHILLYLEELLKQNSISPYSEKQKIITKLIKKVNQCHRSIKQHDSLILKHKTQKNRTYKMLSILRLLFLKMQDLKPIQFLQDEILGQITDPTIKCLKITQFLLFWQYALLNFQYNKSNQWKKMIKNLKDDNQESLFTKVKQISILITQNIHQRYKQDLNSRKEIQSLIKQCYENSQQKDVLSQLSTIEVMFSWSAKFEKQLLIKNPVLKVYEAYIASLKFNLTKSLEVSCFDRLFSSYVSFVKKLKPQKSLKKNKKKVQKCIYYVFQICEGRLDLMSQQIFYHALEQLMEKNILLFILQKFYERLKLMQNQSKQLLSSEIKSFIFVMQTGLDLLANNKNSQILLEEKLNKQQQSQILNKLKKLIYSFKQKALYFDQPWKPFFQTLCTIYEIKRALIATGIYYQQLEKQVIQIYLSLNTQCYEFAIIVSLFCQTLKQLIQTQPHQRKICIQDIIIQLCQRHLQLQYPFLLDSQWNIFIQYIYINVKRDQNDRNRAMVESIIRHGQKPKQKLQVLFFQSRSITFLVEAFCHCTNPQILKNIYKEISFQKCQFKRSCYAFYILFVFQIVYPKLYFEKEVIIRQLKRSCICLKNMSRLHSFISQGMILSFIDLPILIQSKRKKLLCSRMSSRSIQIKKDTTKGHIKLLKSQANKIKVKR